MIDVSYPQIVALWNFHGDSYIYIYITNDCSPSDSPFESARHESVRRAGGGVGCQVGAGGAQRQGGRRHGSLAGIMELIFVEHGIYKDWLINIKNGD